MSKQVAPACVRPAAGIVFAIACAAISLFWTGALALGGADAVTTDTKTWPTIEAPPLHVLDDPRYQSFGLRLLGIDAEQHGRRLNGAPLEIDGGAPVLLRLYWMPERADPGSARIRLKSWSHDSRISKEDDFAVESDAPGQSEWKAGRLYTAEHTWNPREAANDFSGKSFLTLGFLPTGAPANSFPVPLLALPMRLTPAVSASTIPQTEYPRVFGEDYRSLRTDFRLGFQASITLPVPKEMGGRVLAIGIASAFSFGTMPQGARVATVTAVLEGGGEIELALISGESTAKADYDFFSPGHWDHQKIAVLDSTPSGYLGANDTPFMHHKYGGILQVPGDALSVSALRFYMDSPVLLDVNDVVLIRGATPSAETAP